MNKAIAGTALAFMLLGSVPAGASAPHITDMAGDANGLDAGRDTRPASIDAGDMLSVWLETSYVAVPVGDDGVDYRATGLRMRYRTLGNPIHDFAMLAFQIHGTIGGCDSRLTGYVGNASSNQFDGRSGRVRWIQYGPTCPNLPEEPYAGLGFGTLAEDPRWTAQADAGQREVVASIPFDALTPAQAAMLAPGAVIEDPRGATYLTKGVAVMGDLKVSAGARNLDDTAVGADFVIGSDVPADIPCTKGCP